MFSCPRCGEKGTGFMRLCGACQHTVNMQSELKVKAKKRVIEEDED